MSFRTADTKAPTAVIEFSDDVARTVTNQLEAEIKITVSEAFDGLVVDDVVVTNGTVATWSKSGNVITATITASKEGDVAVSLPAGTYADINGNVNTDEASLAYRVDLTAPSATMASGSVAAGQSSSASSVDITLTASESITSPNEISVVNGSLDAVSGSLDTYTLKVTPAAHGEVVVTVAPGGIVDAAGNTNSESYTFGWFHDVVGPTVELAVDGVLSGDAYAYNRDEYQLQIRLSELPSRTLVADDLVISNATVSSMTGSEAHYTATLTPATSDSVVSITLAEGQFDDRFANPNQEAKFSFVHDQKVPTISLAPQGTVDVDGSQLSGVQDITVRVTASEALADFDETAMAVSNGEITEIAQITGDPTAFDIHVRAKNAGAVSLALVADGIADRAGNSVQIDGTTSAFWTFDNATEFSAGLNTSVERGPEGQRTLSFSTFETGRWDTTKLSVTNGEFISFVEDEHANLTAVVKPSVDGEVIVSAAVGAFTDAVGNQSPSQARLLAFDHDATGPTVRWEVSETRGADGQAITNQQTVTLLLSPDEPIQALSIDQISVVNGVITDLQAVTDSNDYTLTVKADAEGEVIVSIPAIGIVDVVGNPADSAAVFKIDYDVTAPHVAASSVGITAGGRSGSESRSIQLVFDEPIVELAMADFSVTNGRVSEVMVDPDDRTRADLTLVPTRTGWLSWR